MGAGRSTFPDQIKACYELQGEIKGGGALGSNASKIPSQIIILLKVINLNYDINREIDS